MKGTPGKPGEQPDYLSYLMRLWRVRNGEKTTWRASLESALSGQTHNFASLDRLCDFLRDQTGHTQDASGDEDDCATTVMLVIHRAGRRHRKT